MSETTDTHRPEQPLRGIRVIEIGHSVAAPFCGQVLADLGQRHYSTQHAPRTYGAF